MTTIVYRDGWLAADSQTSYGAQPEFGSVKITRKGRILAGAAGDRSACIRFLDWVRRGCPESEKVDLGKPPDDDAWGMIWMPDGICVYSCVEGMSPLRAPFHAYGSGKDVAIGALAAGATAIEAVQIARKWDIHTGGPILVASHSSGPFWLPD